ncbi:MAG: hypothetical protein PQJ61_11110 [Spirochaetales bacterium]|uniref:Tetratricopeptide repeat protein n=1 Tax=Candidatus Thalassospirochaeta sargassi TaxID=3119039 RepID=A0AAJ1MP62_9SPIO|nr:hypothetical protein [Spirochaetales bacterium]
MKKLMTPFILLLISSTAFSQGGDVNLNEYYSYPISAGFYYHQMSGITSDALSDFDINQLSGEARYPLPGRPNLQILAVAGFLNYSYTGDDNQDWSHYFIYAGPGIGYTSRLSREFELGADFYCAFAQSYYTELVYIDDEETIYGQQNIIAGLSGRFALNPSYSFSISINPTLGFNHTFGELTDDNGLTLGVGFSGSYRYGEDPDSARSTIKAIRFDKLNLPPLFAAMQSYYVKNRAGSLIITNKEKYTLEDISLSFMQPGFMDSPSPIARDINLSPGESIEIPVTMSFNNDVFATQGVTPLTGEVIANYTVRGREIEQRHSVTYDLYDRNALIWDDDRKAAAFITSQDSAVRNYSSHIRQIHRELVQPYISSNLQFAMQAFNALGEIGILYQIDPTSPFTKMQGDDVVVDSINLPRETLKRLTGDCDDLTVLYCTMLETIGIDTALVTVPGHIFCAFNTGVPSADYKMVNPARNMIIEIDGSIWIPVEITMIGRSSFAEAWSRGYAEYAELNSNPEHRGFYKTAEAQKLFRPVVLRETDLGLQYGDNDAVTSAFYQDLEAWSQMVLKPMRIEAETENNPRSWNSYGVAAAKLGEYREAETAFKKATVINPGYMNAKLNLGSLYYLTGKYSSTYNLYNTIIQEAETSQASKRTLFKLYLNMSKTCYALDENDKAGIYYAKAKRLDPDQAVAFNYLGSGGDITRASDAADSLVMFSEE